MLPYHLNSTTLSFPFISHHPSLGHAPWWGLPLQDPPLHRRHVDTGQQWQVIWQHGTETRLVDAARESFDLVWLYVEGDADQGHQQGPHVLRHHATPCRPCARGNLRGEWLYGLFGWIGERGWRWPETPTWATCTHPASFIRPTFDCARGNLGRE